MPKDNGKSNTLKTVSFDTFYTHFDLKVNRKRTIILEKVMDWMYLVMLVFTVFVKKLSQIDVQIRGYIFSNKDKWIELNRKKER